MENEVKISVRSLAEYVYRSGSIESGAKSTVSFSEGTKIHRDIQMNYREEDKSEVFLKTNIEYEELLFLLEGRCDGLLFSKERVTIDEIKSTSLQLEFIEEHSFPAHWAQAECYAYMYLQECDADFIHVQLTYVQKQTGETKRFIRTRTRDELSLIVLELVRIYAPFARLKREHAQARDTSIKALAFPHESYRKGQRKLAGVVYKTFLDQQVLFASAPTGIGKTISTIFPTVKAVGEGLLNKFFYLTAKTTTRKTAEDALQLMAEKGLCMTTVTITAKEKTCLSDEGICSKESCEFADGFYDRINNAILDILRNERRLDKDCIADYARKHKVCPFEYSLELAYAADAVICDYNYIFDPRVSLKRLFDDQKKHTALLVDEAHNLVDRGREMYSAELDKRVFLALKKDLKTSDPQLANVSKKINEVFIRIRKEADPEKTAVLEAIPKDLSEAIGEFLGILEQKLSNDNQVSELLLEAFFACQHWVRISKLADERFVVYAEINGSEMVIKQFCLDPSHLIRQAYKPFKSTIFFSATLNPVAYYKEMLGWKEGNYLASIPSPFSPEQTEVLIKPLSTRFRDREQSVLPILHTIEQMLSRKPGNCLVFFPSYKYMRMAAEQWGDRETGVETIFQEQGMSEEERASFLGRFQDNTNPLLGFAVLGGVFSEGIDLLGNRLNGVVIVGVGLPQLGLERELIKKHFADNGKNGYDYAYVYPGMNKVLQAGGRLIRSETDTGTLILVDDRYLQAKYQFMLPVGWRDFIII